MATLQDILLSGGAGPAAGPGASLLDELLRRRESAVPGQTPGFNPNAPPPGDIFAQAQRGNFGGPSPTSRVPQRQIDRVASGEGLSIADQVLGKLGKPGRALMPLSNFLGGIGDSLRGAAERGTLGSIAPDFQAGVQRSQQISQGQDRNDINRRFVEAQIAAMQNVTTGAPKAQTEIAKLRQDFENGLISQEVFDAKRNEVLGKANIDRFDQTQGLRGEFNKETSGIRNSLQSLAAAESLISEGSNPISELAAFISTIKSIDNSTVREGELQNFNRAIGLVGQLEQLLSQARGEGFTEELAVQIQDTVKRIRQPLDQVFGASKEFYESEARKFDLDPTSITGIGVAEPGEDDFDPTTLSNEELRRIAAGGN